MRETPPISRVWGEAELEVDGGLAGVVVAARDEGQAEAFPLGSGVGGEVDGLGPGVLAEFEDEDGVGLGGCGGADGELGEEDVALLDAGGARGVELDGPAAGGRLEGLDADGLGEGRARDGDDLHAGGVGDADESEGAEGVGGEDGRSALGGGGVGGVGPGGPGGGVGASHQEEGGFAEKGGQRGGCGVHFRPPGAEGA